MHCSPDFLAYLTVKAGMSECVYNVGVAQVLSQGHFRGGPVRSALYVLVLGWRNDLRTQRSVHVKLFNYEQRVLIMTNLTCQSKSAITLMRVNAAHSVFAGNCRQPQLPVSPCNGATCRVWLISIHALSIISI